MPLHELPAIRRLVAALKSLGFYQVRQKGSHLEERRQTMIMRLAPWSAAA